MNNPIRASAPTPAAIPGRRPRQERSRLRVENILAIALQLMVEQGAEALAMREIARRAEVQISSIYQYFPSKSAIIRELAQRDLARVRQLLQEAVGALLAGPGTPPIAAAVEHLGDASFARRHLGWTPKTSFDALVQEMAAADFALAAREAEGLTGARHGRHLIERLPG